MPINDLKRYSPSFSSQRFYVLGAFFGPPHSFILLVDQSTATHSFGKHMLVPLFF